MTAAAWYGGAKIAVEAWTGLDKDALHIHGAILLYLLITVALRRPGIGAWLAILSLELANELLDLQEQYRPGIQSSWTDAFALGWREAGKDIWNTMIWPTAFLLLGRYGLPARSPAQTPESEAGP